VISPPDLILLDVCMPNLDGFATCRLLKANDFTRSIPIIFLTAAQDKRDRLEGLTLGAVDYIVKPYACEEEVLARINIHLAASRRLGEPGASAMPVAAADHLGKLVSNDEVLARAASELLMDNLAAPLSPSQLARRLGTNEKRLNAAFQKKYALPVAAWVREQRLRLAKQLLAETDTPVSSICEHLGYSSAANFSTAFRLRFDCSPRAFRAQVRAEGWGKRTLQA
jgi:DNA-binding response OmpR family regulator